MVDKKLLVSYVDAMKEAADIIDTSNADYVVSPMLGSVPFIDAMSIVAPNFDPSQVVYMPASSRIENVSNVIKDWYGRFLNQAVGSPFNFPKILGIDEVVSGCSVIRCLKNIGQATTKKRKILKQDLISRVNSQDVETSVRAIDEADILSDNQYSDDFGRIRQRTRDGTYLTNKEALRKDAQFFVDVVGDSLNEKLKYTTIGIEDSKKEGDRNSNYEGIKEQGGILPVKINCILTMDNPKFCPARFEELEVPKGRGGYVKFSPVIGDFLITKEYMEFLTSLAKIVGKNPQEVSPVNMNSILDSSKYLSLKTPQG